MDSKITYSEETYPMFPEEETDPFLKNFDSQGMFDIQKWFVTSQGYADLLKSFFLSFTSQNTRVAYETDLRQFFIWTSKNYKVPNMTQDGPAFYEINKLQVKDYINHLAAEGRARKTIQRKIAAIQSFYEHLMDEEFVIDGRIVEKNPGSRIKMLRNIGKETVRPTEDFDQSEVKEMFRLVLSSFRPWKHLHTAFLTVLFTTGARQSELRMLKMKDYVNKHEKDDEGKMQVHKVLKIVGKGNYDGELTLHHISATYLDIYIEKMKESGRSMGTEDYIFRPHIPYGNDDGPISAQTAIDIVKNYAQKVNPNKRITPHSARATVIGYLLKKEVPLVKVQKQVARHKDPKTTVGYDKKNQGHHDSPIYDLDFF